jgi:hypothetical protein
MVHPAFEVDHAYFSFPGWSGAIELGKRVDQTFAFSPRATALSSPSLKSPSTSIGKFGSRFA